MTMRLCSRAAGRARRAACAAALSAAALSAGGVAAQTGAPGPWEVIGYAGPDFTGPSKTWSLGEGRPYLYVPYVGDALNGALAAVRIGSEVGAALFQRPFFASKDAACAPVLGSDARPELAWLGATARFEPGGAGMPPEAAAAPDPASGGYGSLILFRKDLGPPPGVLLMHRRRMMGSMCPNPVHKTFYKRVFVPVAAAPERTRCFDLAGEFAVADSEQEILFRFTSSDRLVLLEPADLSERYGAVRHRFTVTLFDRLGCRGTPLSFTNTAQAPGTIKLDDFGFRNAARSLRVAYEGGPLDPLLAAAEGAPPPQPASPAQPVRKAPAPAPSEAAEPPPAPSEAAEPAPTPSETTAAAEPAPASSEAAQPAATPPQPASPAQPVRKAPAPRETAEPPPAPRETAEPAPTAIQQAMPKLEPVLLPEGRAEPGAPSQTFRHPVHDIYRLNYCLNWNEDCGRPAAEAWCKTQGFQRASAWTIDENIGALFPTIVIGADRVCARFVCDGFLDITCAK